jgi:hypothetical protein
VPDDHAARSSHAGRGGWHDTQPTNRACVGHHQKYESQLLTEPSCGNCRSFIVVLQTFTRRLCAAGFSCQLGSLAAAGRSSTHLTAENERVKRPLRSRLARPLSRRSQPHALVNSPNPARLIAAATTMTCSSVLRLYDLRKGSKGGQYGLDDACFG